jgi:hypothetical protein
MKKIGMIILKGLGKFFLGLLNIIFNGRSHFNKQKYK